MGINPIYPGIIIMILSMIGILQQLRLLYILIFFEVLILSLMILFSGASLNYSLYLLILIILGAIESAIGICLLLGLYKLGGSVAVNSNNNLWG